MADQKGGGTLATKQGTFMDIMKKSDTQFKRAMPKHLSHERFVRMMLTCYNSDEKLRLCDPYSVIGCFFTLAQLGLEPNTPLGQAWVLPYGGTAQVIIGYKGYVSLAFRAGVNLIASPVYAGDEFTFVMGSQPSLTHKPTEHLESRGALAYAYAVAYHDPNRVPLFRVINRADAEEAMRNSPAWRLGQRNKAKQDSPWYTNEPAMWAKTAIRRLAPFLPMAAELQRAAEYDEAADRGERQQLEYPSKLEALPEPPPSAVADSLDADLKAVQEGASPASQGAE